MYLKSVTRQEMLTQIEMLKMQLEQCKLNHEKEVRNLKLDHQKEVAVLQDELKRTNEIVQNVQFQQYFKMVSDNKKLTQENSILRDMLRACQITTTTKEQEVQRLKLRIRRAEGQSLEVRKNSHQQRHQTLPSLHESETSPKIQKFKIN